MTTTADRRAADHLRAEQIANARLIAEAPAMLELLRRCKDRVLMLIGANSILGVEFADDVKFAKELEAIIAKIEGAA